MALACAIAWGDPRTAVLARNTLGLAVTVVCCALPPGIALAWLLFRTDLPLRGVMSAAIGLMLFVPLYVQVGAWQAAAGLSGWLHAWLAGPVLVDGWLGAIIVHTAAAIPWAVVIVGVGLRLIEPELEESALLDAGPWRVLWHVTLPSATGAIGVATLWIAVGVAGEIAVTDLFRVRTLAEEIYTERAVEPGAMPLRMLPIIGITAGLVFAGLALAAGLMPSTRPVTFRRAVVMRLATSRWPCLIFAALLVGLLVAVPIVSLIHAAGESFIRGESGDVVRSWSLLTSLARVAETPTKLRYLNDFRWSFELGSLAATAALVVAVPLAWFARSGGWRAWPAWSLAAVLWAVPGPLIGLAIVDALNQPGWPILLRLYDDLRFAPVLALALRALPLTILIVWHGLRSIPREILEGAELDGAGTVVQLFQVALPQRLGVLACAWLAAWQVALADLGASLLVLPPSVDTLAPQAFRLLHDGRKQDVAALSLALLLVVSAIALLGWRLVRRWRV